MISSGQEEMRMRSLWKDVAAAFLLGMVLPGIMLNYAVMQQRQNRLLSEIQITIPEETQHRPVSVPVLVRKNDGSVERQEMEEYLVGVVLAEMPVSFEEEALKAQAVAARTYARKAWVTGGKHGDGSVCIQPGCCQAHVDVETYLQQGGTEAGLEKARGAVYATAGECLEFEGELIEATYFSTSGGSTEDAAAVWGTDYPYLQAVDSPGEESARWYRDTVIFPEEQFCNALGKVMEGDPKVWLGAVQYTEGGGVESMVIGGETYTGTQLRSLLGLRSTAFEVAAAEEGIVITTKGYGHRVGMSQYGAEAMAVGGSHYREILSHYYPGTELVMVLSG